MTTQMPTEHPIDDVRDDDADEILLEGQHVGTVRDETTWISKIITMIAVIVPPTGVLIAAFHYWGVYLSPVDVVTSVVMYVACGLGITVGYHRLFSHKSFRTTNTVRGALAILGSMTIQGPVTQWVTDHRKHHAMSDAPGDPHSPHVGRDGEHHGIVGLWWAHMGWLFRTKGMERGEIWGQDLYREPLIRRIDRFYLVWVALSVGIPYLVGFVATGFTNQGGVQTLVWAGLIRIFLFQHATWSINSVCHMFGRRAFRTADHSRNNWLLALPSFGEAWHNNHHAFPGSAVHGIDRKQIDISAGVITLLERMGLAWDVKRMSPGRLEARRIDS